MLLLYCMTEATSKLALPPRGVRGAVVESLMHERLACLFSRHESFPGPIDDELKQAALDFHSAISHVFQQQTVIPFRFPSLLAEMSVLESFLDQHSREYLLDLERLRGLVQMEVRLLAKSKQLDLPAGASGSAYMEAKRAAANETEELWSRIKSAAPRSEWKQRGRRYFALIPRGEESQFRERIAALGDASLRVSGPWPPSEFVNCYPDVPETRA